MESDFFGSSDPAPSCAARKWEEFTDANRTAFLDNAFTVSPQCDRMGARLEGVVLERNQPNERLSEPVAPGTIQVPNDWRAYHSPPRLPNHCADIPRSRT